MHKKQYKNYLKNAKLDAYYAEELTRTYFSGKDYFTFVIIEAIK